MNNQIIAALSKFKVDVYANLTSKDAMKQFLINRLGLQVWSGQKRLVVFDPANPSYVYKIAYSDQGIFDNICEVSCSNKLRMLQQQGHISLDDFNLFGESVLVNGDPSIVRMTAGTNYIQDPDYIRWYQTQQNLTPDYNENRMFADYIKTDNQLIEDHNKIQGILAKYFIPSDVTVFKEPKNYCLRRDGAGRKRLLLIDLGSVCPKLVKNNQAIVPLCEKCGTEKIYVPFNITAQMEKGAGFNIEGLYMCRNPKCSDYMGGALNKTPDPTTKDSYVFSAYVAKNNDLVKRLRAVDGLYFMPYKRVGSKMEYLNEIRNVLGLNPPPQQLDLLFRNYCSYACGMLYSINKDQIDTIPAINGNNLVTFNQYLNMFNQAMMRVGESVDTITTRIAALTYLNILTSRDSDITIFDILTQPDFTQFAQVISNRYRIDQQNGMALFNALNIR